MTLDLAIATCSPLPEPDPDESLLLQALADRGLTAQMVSWHGDQAPFLQARMTLLRSTWNYPHRCEEFLSWTASLGDRLVNPWPVVAWNSHKHYLADLAENGIPIIPTVFVNQTCSHDLEAIAQQHGWTRFVAKPAISCGSYHTRLMGRPVQHDDATWFAARVAERDMMLQGYVESVETYGERAIVVIDGEPTHAVRKAPRFADSHERVSPAVAVADDERALALRAIAEGTKRAAGAPLLYGRVDLAKDPAGSPMIMELELIEPSLFLAQHPPALHRFAEAIARRLSQPSPPHASARV